MSGRVLLAALFAAGCVNPLPIHPKPGGDGGEPAPDGAALADTAMATTDAAPSSTDGTAPLTDGPAIPAADRPPATSEGGAADRAPSDGPSSDGAVGCQQGTKTCNGKVPQTCDQNGQWQNSGAACPLGCFAGVCAVCMPGTRQCAATGVPQLCDAKGQWQSQAACAAGNECSAGLCLCTTCAPVELAAPVGGATEIAVAPPYLYFRDITSIYRITIAQKQTTPFFTPGGSYSVRDGFAADPLVPANIYWHRNDDSVAKADVMVGPALFRMGMFGHLAVAGSVVYFGDGTGISRLGTDKSGPLVVVPAVSWPAVEHAHPLAVAKGHVYWLDSARTVHRAPITGGAPELLYTEPDATGSMTNLAVDDTHVYFNASSNLKRVPITGGAAEPLGSDVINVLRPGFDDRHLYWIATIYGARGACVEARLYRRAKSGGTARAIWSQPSMCSSDLAMDGTTVYWSVSGSSSGLGAGRVLMLTN